MREWAVARTNMDANFKLTFYPSRYDAAKGSILPVGDVTSYIPDHEADVAVLEEPEHLNWCVFQVFGQQRAENYA